jgi:cytochrome P450
LQTTEPLPLPDVARADIPPLPPGPRRSAVWNLLHYSYSPLPFLEGCAARFGDPFTVRFAGYGSFVMLADPAAVRDVFRAEPHVLHSGEGNEFLTPTVGRSSVLVLDDEPHLRQRRILLPPLKGERMRAFFDVMKTATLEAARAMPVGHPSGMVEPMRAITLRVIAQAVLGMAPGPELSSLEGKVNRFLSWGRSRHALLLAKLGRIGTWPVSRWVPPFRRLAELDRALLATIAAQRAQPAEQRGESVLADLLGATHDDGSPLADVELRDALVTLLIAGHDTTALALAWALEQIVSRPDVAGRIGDELRDVTGGAAPRADQLERLVYLDACIRESLRARTILPFVVRLTKRPFVAAGREYPAGVMLCPCNHLVHRRADLYPDPQAFRPERFLERRYAGHEFFPFGGGTRACLGMAFALYEMKVVLGTLFTTLRLARPADSRSVAVRRGVALAPHDGALVTVTERR